MKKLLSIMLMALCTIAAMAQDHWTYDTNSYPDATVVYAKINDGFTRVGDRYEIAAFVGDELRATTRTYRAAGTTAVQYIYTLRVEGSNTDDRNKTITFRLYDHDTNLEYTLAETATYTGETVVAPSNAKSLTLNAASGIGWNVGPTSDLWIAKGETQKLPYYLMDATGMPVDETTLTPFKLCGITVSGNTGNYFTLSADGKSVTGNSITPATPGTIKVNGSTTYTINVYQAIEEVNATTEKITLKVGEEQLISQYYEILPAGCTVYSVSAYATSDAASYVPVNVEPVSGNDKEFTITGLIAGTGTLEITISNQRDMNHPFTLSIPYEVRQQVTSIAFNPLTPVYTGETAYLNRYFTVNPGDATDKSVTITADDASLVNIAYDANSGMWTMVGKKAGTVNVTVASVSDPEVKATAAIEIKQSVESIVVVEPIVIKEEQTIDLAPYYTVMPANAYDKTVSIEAQQYYEDTKTWDGTKGIEVNETDGVWTLTGNFDGEYRLAISSNAAHSTATTVYITVNVTSKLRGIRIVNADGNDISNTGTQMVMGETVTVKVQAMPETYDIDANSLTATVTGDEYAAGWAYVAATRSGLNYSLTGRALTTSHYLNVTYTEDGETFTASIPVKVGQHINLEEGWNWSQPFSMGTTSDDYSVQALIADEVVDMRTETGLLFNDPEWGLFGDINDVLAPSRIKVSEDVAYDYFCQPLNAAVGAAPVSADLNLHARWNWINYPYMYARNLSEIYTNTCGANEGDVIKTQTGFSTYEGGAWTNDLLLYPGESMAYYNAAGSKTVIRPLFSELDQPAARSAAPRRVLAASSPWEYNPRQFMDNMGMIAVLDLGDDIDLDNYSIGAFVGDECRGEGKLNDGRWFITIHGEAGEQVKLKLLNKYTDQLSDLDGTFAFEAMLGSVKAPVSLTAPNTATDIISVGSNIKEDARVYTLDGKQVDARNLSSGIYVVNGKKIVVK